MLLSCERTISALMSVARIPFHWYGLGLLTLQAFLGKQVAQSNHDLPALELLIEIELEDGSRDSLRRAVDYRQGMLQTWAGQAGSNYGRIDPRPLVWTSRDLNPVDTASWRKR